MAWELFNEVELTDGYVDRGLREIWNLADRHGDFAPRLDTGIPPVQDGRDVEIVQAEQGVLGKLAETWSIMGGTLIQSLGPGSGHRHVARWHSEMAAHIRSIDPTGRLITTSSPPRESTVWRDMDYYQIHLYHREMIAPLARLSGGIDAWDKPVFVGEMGDHEIVDPHKHDGRHVLPMLWAGLFSGAAGAAQLWAWDTVQQLELDDRYRVITSFLAEGRMAERAYRPVDVQASRGEAGAPLIALALIAEEAMLLWLHDPDSVSPDPPRQVTARITLPEETHGIQGHASWWDTLTGKVIARTAIAPGQDTTLEAPRFSGHIAAIITPDSGSTFRRSR